MGSCTSRQKRRKSGKPTSPLFQIPNELLLGILLRVDNVGIYRIRRTCSFMNVFIEAHQLKFVSRPHFGIQIGLSYRYEPRFLKLLSVKGPYFFYDSYKYYFRKNIAFLAKSNFNERLSSVSIKSLSVTGRNYYSQTYKSVYFNELKKVISKLENKSIPIRVVDFPNDCVADFLDSIDYPGLITIILSRSIYFYRYREGLEACEKVNNAHRLFHIFYYNTDNISNFFNRTKYFYGFLMYSVDHYHEFIRDLYHSKAGNLKLAVFITTETTCFYRNYPQPKVLWSYDKIPKSRLAREETPITILKFELKSQEKCAIVVLYVGVNVEQPTRCIKPCNIFGVFVVRNNKKEMLDCVLKNLGIPRIANSLRDEFYNSCDELVPSLIRKMYLESDSYNTPLDCLMNPELYY